MRKYELFKTAKKTAKENGLVYADNQRIFDFSKLEDLEIPEEEKQEMKEVAIKTVTVSFNTAYCIKRFNNFHFVDGYVDYSVYKVYDNHGKQLYCIFEVTNIHHVSCHRKCVWDEYEYKTIDKDGCVISRDINFNLYSV